MKTKFLITVLLLVFLAACAPATKTSLALSATKIGGSYPPCTTQYKTQSTPSSSTSNFTSLDLSNGLSLIEYQDNYFDFPMVESGCFYNSRDRVHATEITLDNLYQVNIKSIDSQNELVTVLKDGKIVYEVNIRTSTYSGLLEAWGYQDHWVIEVVTANGIDIIQDGQSLKEKNHYEKVFAFQLLNNKPFYFFKKSGYGFGVNYNNNEIKLEYDDIPYYNAAPGSGGTIHQFQNMVLFYGVKNGAWHYALIGSFK